MSAADPLPFDLGGPLPQGVTLLEASAGTGKTFTIAGLVARYVAEGTPLERILVVTFTRMATGELRERVRERLVSAADALAGVLAGDTADPEDAVLGALGAGGRDEVRDRHDRLAKAVADFDAATIETTHGFCLHVLAGLGVAGDVARDVTFTEDVRDLLEEVVDDLYVRRYWRPSGRPAPMLKRSEALDIGLAVLANPATEILPAESTDRDAPAVRGRLARRIGEELDRRKRARGTITYDDLLLRLDDALADAQRGPEVARRLRGRYDVALVDEFQDTDLVQWDIMRRAFGSGGSTLVLIGDPKQAIYAFRGADVYSYLRAAEEAGTRATLTTNWRSDQGLLDALDTLLSGSQLGHAGIAYHTVRAAPANTERRLSGAGAPLRVRIVDRTRLTRTKDGFAQVDAARAHVATDLAGDVVALLESGAEIDQPGGRAPVHPGDLAVLVRTNQQARDVVNALGDRGVPAVTGGAGSVFATRAAEDWLTLLEALERPTSRDRVAATALGSFVGWRAAEVASAGEAEWEDLHWLAHRWSAVLRRRGVAALYEQVSTSGHLAARLLGRTGGERLLTDLGHIAQLLHAEARTEDLGAAALTAWLRRRRDDADRDADNEDRSRRLDSDAQAVQVLTVHRSKGLEFPIVYCPFLWDGYKRKPTIPVFHDPANGETRTADVGGPDGTGFRLHQDLAVSEVRGEDVRHLYVALTRARHQAVLWWAGSQDSRTSPLSRLLFDRDDEGVVAPDGSPTPDDGEVHARFTELAAASGGSISVEWADGGGGPRWAGPERPVPELSVGAFDRSLDPSWRRTSYSAITAGLYEAHVGSEPEEGVLDDEFEGAAIPAGGDEAPALRAAGLLLGDLPAGAEVGTLVHRVLERTDFTAPDLLAELAGHIEAELAWSPIDLGGPEAWAEGLAAALATPLGPLVGDVALCQVGRGDRLDELDFELPLVGGDRPTGSLRVGDMAAALSAHLSPDDPLAPYAADLADPALDRVLRGYLVGSLDLVLRLPDGRFAVADYKTNRLGGGAEHPPSAWDYRAEALGAEMRGAHYPLQALLYTVALHRYLRWRVADYAVDRHLAGVLYLFVRGMSSPDRPRSGGHPCGVWAWKPPAALVEALSDLFDRGRP